jgi:ribose 5-phosphate isomerase B
MAVVPISKVFLGSDHAGYALKEKIKRELAKHFRVEDLSPDFVSGDDYPHHAHKVCRAVKQNSNSRGILVCGSGLGMSIAANRHKGIRAVDAYDSYTAKMSRADEDSNVLCLRARKFSAKKDMHILKLWLATKFSGKARHKRRIEELDDY